MTYTLPNGQTFELSRVTSVSKVRDYGRDSKTIDQHLMGFAIHLQRREVIEVTDIYYFSDWAEVKNRMNRLREDILNKMEEETPKNG